MRLARSCLSNLSPQQSLQRALCSSGSSYTHPRMGRMTQVALVGLAAGATLTVVKRLVRGDDDDASPPQRTLTWVPPPPAAASVAVTAARSATQRPRYRLVGTEAMALLVLLLACATLVHASTLSTGACTALVLATAWSAYLLGAATTTENAEDELDAAAAAAGAAADALHARDDGGAAAMPPLLLRANPDLTGTWVKVPHLSDPMDDACDAMQLNGVVRVAIRLVRGIEIKLREPSPAMGETMGVGEAGPASTHDEPATFELAVFSVFPWFKVREQYKLDGSIGRFNRRDLRRGKHQGSLTVLPSGSLQLRLVWDDPHGGQGTDDFVLLGPNELVVTSHLQVDGGARTSTFRTVYHRKR